MLIMGKVTTVKEVDRDIVCSDSLYENYYFVGKELHDGKKLIPDNEIFWFVEKQYHRITKSMGDLILSVAEYGEGSDELGSNFNIYPDGKLYLGFEMNNIRKFIDEYRREWKEYNTRPKYSKVTFKLI